MADKKIDLNIISDDAKAIAGCWFGLMKIGSDNSGLTLHLKELKPVKRTQDALDELVKAGVISVMPFNEYGGLVYRPLVNCHPAFRWFMNKRSKKVNWVLMEPVKASSDD